MKSSSFTQPTSPFLAPHVMTHLTPYPPSVSRYSEKSFRKYEKIYSELLQAYPDKPLIFKIEHGSVNTHVARIRDSANSFKANKFPSYVNHEKFTLMWDAVIVKHLGDGNIFIGKREQLKVRHPLPPAIEPEHEFNGLTIDNPTVELFTAFLVILDADVLNKASIKFTNLNSEIQTKIPQLESHFPNVVFDFLDPKTILLI